jgi:hypothetical protein
VNVPKLKSGIEYYYKEGACLLNALFNGKTFLNNSAIP